MSEAVTEGESVQTAVPAVIATEPPPAFRTPLLVRLFLVAAAVVLIKTIYDISEQSKAYLHTKKN